MSTFTPNKNLEQPASGSYNDAWATPVNADWAAIDNAFGGVSTIPMMSPYVIMTPAQYQPPNLILTGVLSAQAILYVPQNTGGLWSVWNNTTGNYPVLMLNDVASYRTVTLPQGERTLVISDGFNCDLAFTPHENTGVFTGTLTGVSGTVTGTVNYVISGNLTCVHVVNQISGTSTSQLMSLTGLPPALQPRYTVSGPAGQYIDNGYPINGAAAASGSTLSFSVALTNSTPPNRIVYSASAFTASGIKGLGAGFSFFYPLI